MNAREPFYVILPSNVASTGIKNTMSNYKTRLPQTLKLDGSWEVGVVEFQSPSEIANITPINNKFKHSGGNFKGGTKVPLYVNIKKSTWLSPLISAIQTKLDSLEQDILICYNSDLGRVVLQTSPNNALSFKSKEVEEVLGLFAGTLLTGYVVASFKPQTTQMIQNPPALVEYFVHLNKRMDWKELVTIKDSSVLWESACAAINENLAVYGISCKEIQKDVSMRWNIPKPYYIKINACENLPDHFLRKRLTGEILMSVPRVPLAEIGYNITVFQTTEIPLTEVTIKSGFYKTHHDLVEAIHMAIPTEERVHYDFSLDADHTLRIQCHNSRALNFPQELGDMLGLKDSAINATIKKTCGQYPIDIRRGIYSMYIYCDLIYPQIVGDKYAPVLRTVPTSVKSSDLIVYSYSNIAYYPLKGPHISDIEIALRSDFGDLITFTSGKTVIKLHFRKRQEP